MKIKDLRELTRDELFVRHEQLWGNLFGMRIKHALGQLENPLQLRNARRDIARVRTLLAQQGIKDVARPRRKASASAQVASTKAAPAKATATKAATPKAAAPKVRTKAAAKSATAGTKKK
jgi:large subunit ribosomal protein L29